MRYGNDHKEQTRRRVLSEAAAAIRVEGPERISVAALMAKAGLTHGGFYAHFKSKDDLVAQAITGMFDETYDNFLHWTRDRPPAEGLARFVDRYVSVLHRDTPGQGCPIPCLSGDLSRMPAEARERFTLGVMRLETAIATLLCGMGAADSHGLARSALAEMVGAVALSRAVSDRGLSEKMLEDCRAALKTRLGC